MIKGSRKCGIIRGLSVGFIFLFGVAFLPLRLVHAKWRIDCVDCDVPREFSDFTPNAMAIDSQGRPHLVYGGNNLYHAYFNGAEWVIETVDTQPGIGSGAAIAIDAVDGIHIAYPDNSRGDNDGRQKAVKYASNTSGTWVIESIPVEVAWWGNLTFVSIAVDNQKKAHICYFSNYPPERLDYVTNVTGQWIIQTVERADQTGQYNDIAVDEEGYVHISYMSYVNSNESALKYATNRTGGWEISTVQSGLPKAGSLRTRFTSLVLDSSSVPHIAYIAGEARYATYSSGAWRIENIEGPIAWNSYPSMVGTSSGALHLVYMGASGVRYAKRDSGGWTIADGPSGNYRTLALAVDSTGVAHLGSLYSTSDTFANNRIEYSTNAGGAWITSVIDEPSAGRDAGKEPKVAVDPEGAVHLTYLDATNQTIKRADESDGTWSISDLFGAAAASSQLINDGGVNRFSYEDRTTSTPALRYAFGTPGSWISEEIVQGPFSSWPNQAMAQDGTGTIHVAFCEENTMWNWYNLSYRANAGGNWMTSKSIGGSRYDCGVSLATDTAGTVHLLAHLGDSSAMPPLLKYWTNASGSFQSETFGRGYAGSLILDQSGAVHVAYIKAERAIPGTGIVSYYQDLAYATNASGAWVKEDVDLAPYSGAPMGAASIVLDSAGRVHIAYSDSNTLKHAVRENNAWTIEMVDQSVNADQSSIAVDGDGGIHIAYYDGSWGDLRYALSPGIGVCTYYRDADGDGYGVTTDTMQTGCGSVPYGFAEQAGDCNDLDPTIYPGILWYKDADGDGYSDGTTSLQCEQPQNYVRASEILATSGDCDDGNAEINPATVWYRDNDADGYSDGIIKVQCSRPDGYSLPSELMATMGDCNDEDGAINPANPAGCTAVKSADGSDLDRDGIGDGRDEETLLQGDISLDAGEYIFKRLVLNAGARVRINPTASSNRATIHASEIVIAADASLSAAGYPSDSGPGAGSPSMENGGGGAGHGGKGGSAGGAGGSSYGVRAEPEEPGSGGGSGENAGGAGGGELWLIVGGEFRNDGLVSVAGNNGDGDGGGGSGGSLYVLADSITGSGRLSADGGDSVAGGGGAGGRMALYSIAGQFDGSITAGGGNGINAGEQGTIVRSSMPIASAASMSATSVSADTALSATIVHRKLALRNAAVSGALSGELRFTQLDSFAITTGAFAGKGVWRGTWTAVLGGSAYAGEWKGLAFPKSSESKICLKAALSGGVSGIAEGFLSETTSGNGVFDHIEMQWTLSRLGDASTSAVLKITGLISYADAAAYENVEINALQATVQGTSTGDYAGALQTVLTGVRFLSSDIPCYGEGFAFLSYITLGGSGEAWAYMRRVGNEEFELTGVSNAPMRGRLTGTLYESGWPEPKLLLLGVDRLDWALPAMPDLKISTWGPGMMSSGQTEDYIIEYRNDGLANAEDVVVVDRLPHVSEYIANSPGGFYRWDTHEVIWRLGTVPPQTRKYLSVRIKVPFGTELGTELANTAGIASTTMTVAGYRNADVVPPFDIQEYLAYEPTTIYSTRRLSIDDIASFRSDAAVQDLYRYALELGFIDSSAGFEDTTASGAVLTHLIFLRQDNQDDALALVKVSDPSTEAAYLIETNGAMVGIFEREGGLSYNINHSEESTNAIGYWGSWSPHSPSRTSCTVNCLVSKIPGLAVDYFGGKFIKALSAVAGEIWSFKAFANAAACTSGYRSGCLDNSAAGMNSSVGECSSRCGKDTTCYRACIEEKIPVSGSYDLFKDASFSCGLSSIAECRSQWEAFGKASLKTAARFAKEVPIVDVLYALGSCHRDCILDVAKHACNPGDVKYQCASPWQKLWTGGDVMGYKCDEFYVWGGVWGAPPDTWSESCPKGTTCKDITPYATSKGDLCKSEEEVPEKDEAPIITTTGHDPNYKARIDFDSEETLPAGECALAGDTLKYRVEFENEGAGIAFGVYVADVLDPRLDPREIGQMFRVCRQEDSSCIPGEPISDGGVFDPATRTITWTLWNEGRVNSMQGGYAIVTAQIASAVPDGEEISNYATVYFASVPEVTRTNAVVTKVGSRPVWHRDEDGDGYGDAEISLKTCSPPENYVANADDCNDGNSSVNPGVEEVCGDGIDNNCDGQADEGCATAVKVSGGAYFYPETSTYKATFSLDAAETAYSSSWLKYYYARTRMSFVSTAITAISASGKTVTVSGAGKVNGAAGYTFAATITDGSPDAFGIVIYKAAGTAYYSVGPKPISGGDLVIQ